jgi:hypothetical protein
VGPKKTRGSCRAFFLLIFFTAMTVNRLRHALSHHQHVEDDDRRQGQDRRPDAERPNNVSDAKALLFRDWIVLGIHDDFPGVSCFVGFLIRVEFLKSRLQIRAHLNTGATAG